MRNNTHSELISVEIDGKKFTAFIDGIPDKCEHDDNGEELFFNDAGQYFKKRDMPDYNKDYNGWLNFQKKNNIIGGCVSCSKCGKPYTPDF